MKKTLRNNIYTVPEGYFEALPDRIVHKKKLREVQIVHSSTQPKKVTQIIQNRNTVNIIYH